MSSKDEDATSAVDPRALEVRRLLAESQRSLRWLGRKIGSNHATLGYWVNGEGLPRDPTLPERALAALKGDVTDRAIAAGPPTGFLSTIAPLPPAPFTLPFAGVVPASEWGDPLEGDERIEMNAEFDGPGVRFVGRVAGESCYPALKQGDLTIWRQDYSPPNGVIVLAERKGDHGCTVKRLKIGEDGKPALIPVNPRFAAPTDGDGWGVIARLVGVERQRGIAKIRWAIESGVRPSDLMEDLD